MPQGLRSRSTELVTPTTVTVFDYNSSWKQTIPSNQTELSAGITEYCSTNWRNAIKNGTILIGEMTRSVNERTAGSGYITEASPINGYSIGATGDLTGLVRNSAPLPPFNTDPETIRSRARANAIIDAYAKANGSETFAGETIAQLTETVAMLRNPFGLATKLSEKILRRQQRFSRKYPGVPVAQALSNAILEYRYGWKPLMMDIELIMNSIVGLHQQLKRRVVIRGAANEPAQEQVNSFTVGLPGDLARWKATGAVTQTLKVRARAGVIIDIEPMSTLEMFSKVFGFRCRDIPATIWALTPLSFVVDWFTNVEGWLQAVIPDPNVSYRGAWVTTIVDKTSVYDRGSISGNPVFANDPNSGAIGYYGSDKKTSVTIVREPNPSLPSTPVLESKILSLIHQIDGMCLTIGALTGRLRDIDRRSR